MPIRLMDTSGSTSLCRRGSKGHLSGVCDVAVVALHQIVGDPLQPVQRVLRLRSCRVPLRRATAAISGLFSWLLIALDESNNNLCSAHVLEIDEAPGQRGCGPRHGEIELQVICSQKVVMMMRVRLHVALARHNFN